MTRPLKQTDLMRKDEGGDKYFHSSPEQLELLPKWAVRERVVVEGEEHSELRSYYELYRMIQRLDITTYEYVNWFAYKYTIDAYIARIERIENTPPTGYDIRVVEIAKEE